MKNMAKNETKKTETKNNKPEFSQRAGTLQVNVWKNESENKDGKTIEFYNIQLKNSYFDKKDDEFKPTDSIKVADTPKAIALLQKAYEYVVLQDEKLSSDDDED